MNQKLIIAVAIVVAFLAAGYLWYANQEQALPPQLSDGPLTNSTPPTEPEIEEGIEGSWRSKDDARFTRSFSVSGVATDRYEGDASATVSGPYELDGDNVPAQVRAVADGSPVLSIAFPEESLFFLVSKVDSDELELVYIGGSGVLKFERI